MEICGTSAEIDLRLEALSFILSEYCLFERNEIIISNIYVDVLYYVV